MKKEIFEEIMRIARKECSFISDAKRKIRNVQIKRSSKTQIQNTYFNFPLKQSQKEQLYKTISNGRAVTSADNLTELEAWIFFSVFTELLLVITTNKPNSEEAFKFFGGAKVSDY